MNVQVTSRPTIQPAATSKLAIADGDIHPQRNSDSGSVPVPGAALEGACAKTFGIAAAAGVSGRAGLSEGPAERLAPRRLAAGGGRPGSSLPFMQKQLLDENNIQLGILNADRRQRRELPEPRVRRRASATP